MSLSTSSLPFDPSLLPVMERRLTSVLAQRTEKTRLENSLIEFVKAAWPYIDSTSYQEGWAIEALCEHLQAVTEGHVDKLLTNFPPRCGKTKVASVCYPAWVWARRQRTFWSGPGVRFLCGSYNHSLSLDNSTLCRRLILSPWYQRLWGDHVQLRDDQNSKYKFDTTENGSRIATSVGGTLLGVGGDIILIDDPHNTEQVESDADRETATNWWREVRSTRLNDPKRSALIVIMQRLHEDDVSGLIAKGQDYEDWTHLMLPMRHDVDRHCVTVLKYDTDGAPEREWEDPRSERELLWPDRFGEHEVELLERELGPYMASGRLQQAPSPKGGGILKRDYWQIWEKDDFPKFEYVLVSADTAYTEKEQNDPTGCTVWGLFREGKFAYPKVMLLWAWREHLELHGEGLPREPGETAAQNFHRARKAKKVGLVEMLAFTCRRFKADRLLIEAKASGLSAGQELRRLHGHEGWGIQLVTPEGDKVARAHAVEPSFAQKVIYAPDREWADKVIDEAAAFPKGRYKDLTDSTTQALKFLREQGLIVHVHEVDAEDLEAKLHHGQKKALYDV